MCGRYELCAENDHAELQAILDEINRKHTAETLISLHSGEIFPTALVPVITARGAAVMRWGMPKYQGKGVYINARSETVKQLPSFSQAFESRRIAVPTNGFYEWMHEGGKSGRKHHFTLPGEALLYLAGIYTEYHLPEGKECRFAILTTDANDSMSPFHDRMPVLMRKSELDAWLRDRQAAEALMRRVPPTLNAQPVEPEKLKPDAPVQLSFFDDPPA